MASQNIIPAAAAPGANDPASITLSPGFAIQSVDGNLEPSLRPKVPFILPLPGVPGPGVPSPATPAQAPLGVLSNFTGTFAGTGFNLIFRPNGAPPTTIIFPVPVSPPPPAVPNENVLELNLTTETLSFSKSLGNVPNRGLGLDGQQDIELNGVPYVQAISDVTNVNTGKADGTAAGIHFEPGLWMHVPATTVDPVLSESLVRMASIPHGTTINAQSLSPPVTFPGPPPFTDFTKIPKADPTPFTIAVPNTKIPFAAQNVLLPNTPRIPQDLTKFNAAGTITQAILDNPNIVLQNANQGKTITQTIAFTVSTNPQAAKPTSAELGGGTANIEFLEGTGATATSQPNANANAVRMDATFWIETVEHKIIIPPFKPGQPPLQIQPPVPHPGAHVPTFLVNPPHEITLPKTITVHSTQIQYSQTVFLNFAKLSWPHISVATLVPTVPLPVPPTVWQ
jgi:hypothetical protein